jgi:hypothetical protein
VIRLPRRSVTRFFIPLIDVLILLFAIFLLMPFVSDPAASEPQAKVKAPDKPLPTDVKELQDELAEARLLVARLERERQQRLTDRLAVRILEIDANDGTLFYYDPNREEIRNDADATRMIQKAITAASADGVVKDVYFLILYPKNSNYPNESQLKQIEEWFKGRPHGFNTRTGGK